MVIHPSSNEGLLVVSLEARKLSFQVPCCTNGKVL